MTPDLEVGPPKEKSTHTPAANKLNPEFSTDKHFKDARNEVTEDGQEEKELKAALYMSRLEYQRICEEEERKSKHHRDQSLNTGGIDESKARPTTSLETPTIEQSVPSHAQASSLSLIRQYPSPPSHQPLYIHNPFHDPLIHPQQPRHENPFSPHYRPQDFPPQSTHAARPWLNPFADTLSQSQPIPTDRHISSQPQSQHHRFECTGPIRHITTEQVSIFPRAPKPQAPADVLQFPCPSSSLVRFVTAFWLCDPNSPVTTVHRQVSLDFWTDTTPDRVRAEREASQQQKHLNGVLLPASGASSSPASELPVQPAMSIWAQRQMCVFLSVKEVGC